MKLFLIGASGMIGSRILAEATARGHQVVAASRAPENIVQGAGVTPVKVDATDADALQAKAAEADVILSASSPRSTGDAVADATALGAALIGAASNLGKRVVVVGGAGTLNLPDGTPVLNVLPPEIVPEATGMKAVRDALAQSTLDWSFVAPAAQIAPGARTGTFRVGGDVLLSDAEGTSAISAEDYAIAFMDEVETPAHIKQVFTVAY
ncbi:NAD(P)-dependent oxidoreductase [Actibacterium lipolyticum]|uniref:Short chain dehydrogenase n=1 Tax=Actibacterium lipolyticum TaxID=1524263 RepID=A0A238KTJ6_9RHOB|nr:NAD(P)H-binding protein [Actibacterium lipolyticum]SMX46164.1 short chain dehydrogenase [Actibacterium lipolyticum]